MSFRTISCFSLLALALASTVGCSGADSRTERTGDGTTNTQAEVDSNANLDGESAGPSVPESEGISAESVDDSSPPEDNTETDGTETNTVESEPTQMMETVETTEPDPTEPAADGYPAGPYGEDNPMLGDVVENLPLRGLFNFTAGTSTELDIEDGDFETLRATGKRFVLLITAMAWCGSCKIAAREMGQEREAQVQAVTDAGGLVAHLLLQGNGSEAPTDEEIHNWARAAELDISVLGPASDRMAAVFPEREWVYVVDLETMEVVFRQEVPLYQEPTVSELGLTELERLLSR